MPFQNSQVSSFSQGSNDNSWLKTQLKKLSKLDRLNYKEVVVKFWAAKIDEMPELAKILLAVPATQVL